ncbi:M1 family aminopeptidase [Croceitalea marina]|uniref:Transcription initiation factor TFIID subunit 2 n=1 Tax=Croceitalea marina TaxID=1775166 RepID=A0ABW5MXD6_9FLAO
MKQLFIVLSFLLLLSCGQTYDGDNDSGKIDVTHQILNIEVHPEQYVTGETTLFLSINSDLSEFSLSAAEMDILSVELNENTVKHELDRKEYKLQIKPDRPLEAGKEAVVKITYKAYHKNQSDPANIWGSFGKGVRYFKPTKTEKERRNQAWAFGEAESSKYWFPCNNDPSDLRTTEITIKGFSGVLSNGRLVNTIKHPDGVEVTYKEDIPYAAYQTFFVVGDYHNYQQSYEDVILNNYGYPDEKTGTKESVISLPDMMKYFSEYTGTKYPYETYSQIFVQDFAGWKPALATSIITENMVDDKTTHEDFLYGWDLTQGEALAAQWFGNYLKPKTWNDIWLSKGFSRYFSGLYTKHANGETEFLTYLLSPDLFAYLGDWNSGTNTRVVQDSIPDLDSFVNSNAPYAKGARVLHMLRKELGEEKWKEVIKTYVKDHGNKLVTTAKLIESVNKVSNKPMDWFFKQWVFEVGHPKFKIDYDYDEASQEFTLNIHQNQKVDSIVHGRKIPFFKGKMLVEIDDGIKDILIEPKSKNSYVFSLSQAPKLINIDFEDTWIKEIEPLKKSTDQLLAELINSKDGLHRVTVMRRLANMALKDSTGQQTQSKIKNALLDRAVNEKYWRMRVITTGQLARLFPSDVNGMISLDSETEKVLLQLVEREESWAKAWTINFLGNTRDKKYVPIYLKGLSDYSDRVVFMSAIALGKSKDARAYDALMQLPQKPSWKNQSLISSMYGLKELQDHRAYDFVLSTLVDSEKPHWNLGTPIWDHRLAAANTLVALERVEQGYDLVYKNYKDALANNNINDIFYNTQLISVLGDSRGIKVFDELNQRFKGDENALTAIEQLKKAFESTIKN